MSKLKNLIETIVKREVRKGLTENKIYKINPDDNDSMIIVNDRGKYVTLHQFEGLSQDKTTTFIINKSDISELCDILNKIN